MDKYERQILETIQAILGKEVGVFLFGSRARDDYQEFSDFDIGLYSDDKIKRENINLIYKELEASTIPFKVDIIDFTEEKGEFAKIATKRVIIWQNHSLIQRLIKNIKN